MFRTISNVRYDISQTFGEGKEDYGADDVRRSEMRVRRGDLVSRTRTEKNMPPCSAALVSGLLFGF